ncbi:glutamate 5-kinase, partial [Cutibacterium acnes subsp. acnes]|nr:glutamate 5-kinase [Cutibacterium acnes subsp. acnes]
MVVKLGTSSLVDDTSAVSQAKIDRIVDAIEARTGRGGDVIVVSSGAIAAGMTPLGLTARPKDLATKQAAASVGQIHLAQAWGESF